jgi:hypothetical protein
MRARSTIRILEFWNAFEEDTNVISVPLELVSGF